MSVFITNKGAYDNFLANEKNGTNSLRIPLNNFVISTKQFYSQEKAFVRRKI